jgi:glutaredoxin
VTRLHLYVTTTCPRCRAVERWLNDRDIPFTETNMEALPPAEADAIRSSLAADGYTQAPAVYFTDDESGVALSFTGFDVTQLETIHAHLASRLNNS